MAEARRFFRKRTRGGVAEELRHELENTGSDPHNRAVHGGEPSYKFADCDLAKAAGQTTRDPRLGRIIVFANEQVQRLAQGEVADNHNDQIEA